MAHKILVVDDEPFNLDLLEQELTEGGSAVQRASSGAEAVKRFEASPPDLVLVDQVMPGASGLDVLREIRQKDREVPVIIVTAHGTIDLAVQAMKQGAYDFLTKPFDPEHVRLTVERALERSRLRRGIELLSSQVDERYREIVGTSAPIAAAVDTAKKAAGGRSTVLLLGESGTGKELFARATHGWSDRGGRPDHRGHESRPGGSGQGRPFPRRPLLPTQRDPDHAAPVERTTGGHRRPGEVLPAPVLARVEEAVHGDHASGAGKAGRLHVAGQHTRAGQRDRARGRPGGGTHDRAPRPATSGGGG